MSKSIQTPEAILRKLEWTVLRRLDGMLHGDYHTLFRGLGVDLADLREYQYSDDVRHIDWNVTARMQTPYIREYYEERDLSAWFLLDLSPSVNFGSHDVKKCGVATEMVAVLASMLSRQGNRVGALFYGNGVDEVIPAHVGRRHVLHILHKILDRRELPQSSPTKLHDLLQTGLQVMTRRSLVFIVSDFISQPGWEKPLAQLAQRHEVVVVCLYDEMEMSLPDLGMVVMQDAETGEQLFVDTHDHGFRKHFAATAARHEDELRMAFTDAGIDALELATDDNVMDALMRFSDMRKFRSRVASGAMVLTHLEQR